jgi:hypothetical protein
MKKLHSLRAYLVERIPDLKRNPDRMLTFIEDGSIEFHRGAHLSHEYRVPVRIVLTDHSGELDTVFIPLLQWLSRYQPDINPQEGITFQAELLSNKAWDLAIDVTLTERVVALVDCDAGTIHVDHRQPEYAIDPCAAGNWQLFIRDVEASEDYDLVAEWGEE